MPRAIRGCSLAGYLGDVYTDWKHLSADDPSEGAQNAGPEFLSAGPAQHIIAKAVEVGLGLEADQIVRAQRPDQLLMVGEDAKQFGAGEGGMQEKTDRLRPIQLAQLLAQRDQMIVVNPDEIVR